jgi:hypothetical protein
MNYLKLKFVLGDDDVLCCLNLGFKILYKTHRNALAKTFDVNA